MSGRKFTCRQQLTIVCESKRRYLRIRFAVGMRITQLCFDRLATRFTRFTLEFSFAVRIETVFGLLPSRIVIDRRFNLNEAVYRWIVWNDDLPLSPRSADDAAPLKYG